MENKLGNDGKTRKRTSWKGIVGGDILATDFFRRQTKLLVLVMAMIIFYIHNRYACQRQLIEMDRLKKELTDIRYDALTRSSEWMERSRQSRVEEYIGRHCYRGESRCHHVCRAAILERCSRPLCT